MRKLFLSIIALTLSIGLWAQETTQTVSYLYPVYNTTDDPTSGIKEWKTGEVEATVVEASSSFVYWGQDGKSTWYVVTGANVYLDEGAVCNGNVHLILADGAKLTATGLYNSDFGMCGAGIHTPCNAGCSFSVYGQTNQSGQLEATGSGFTAGIGGNYSENGSNITINGGIITARSGDFCAGIGGGGHKDGSSSDGYGSNITINGGTVTAIGGENGAGIGGGFGGSASNITINGGTVTAFAGEKGAGIGGGWGGSASNITINGGTVSANGGTQASGIGGGKGGSASNIKVVTTHTVRADGNNPPTTVIDNNGGDLAESLAGKRYVIVFDLAPIKAAAIEEIDLAIEGVTDENILAIANTAKTNIGNATTEEAINSIKTLALAKINALYQILIARQGIQNAEINSMINDAVNIISNATTEEQIDDAKLDAMTIIGLFQNGKAEGKAEALGPLGEEQPGPAVKVTKGDTEVILYLPDKVEYIIRK